MDMLPSSSSENQEEIALKRALEWELSLDSRDLRSHAWYHGGISRQRAEEIVQKEGDFLVRDCASHPGNFVLTCKTKSSVLHFVINKILCQPETVYERTQYQFEDDAYDTLPDLITFYVGSGKPISVASGARIQYPCNRIYPLSFYGNKMVGNKEMRTFSNNYRSPMPSPPRSKREIPPQLPSKKHRSQSLTPLQGIIPSGVVNKYSSADGVTQNKENNCPSQIGSIENNRCNGSSDRAENAHLKSLRSSSTCLQLNSLKSSNIHSDNNSESSLSPCTERNHNFNENMEEKPPSPPPKPSRNPLLNKREYSASNIDQHLLNRVTSYHASGSDSGNGSGDSIQSSAATDPLDGLSHRGVIIKNPRFIPNSASSATLKSFSIDFDISIAEQEFANMEIPQIEEVSKFDLENFHTLLLPTVENKPLEVDALNIFKSMLLETGPRIIAQHLTQVDIQLILDEFQGRAEKSVLDCCGLELITLPHGRIFRRELVERTECLKFVVAITILTSSDDLERAEILDKWIQVAVETKTALGNLFGFSAIMLGLCMPQIQQLHQTWHVLRQKFTESAFTFEAKLRPILKSMNDCTNPQAPNTTVPHVLPYIILKDRNIEEVLLSQQQPQTPLDNSNITFWETNSDDFGVSTLFSHLDSSRNFTKNLTMYKRNAQIVLKDLYPRLDELLLDAFRTEFHIKFLWGSKGAALPSEERFSKMEQVLVLMTEKFCNGENTKNENR